MLKIGSLTLNLPFILAPMAGITDLPFRMICRRLGCELAFIEMTSAKALVYENRKTEKMVANESWRTGPWAYSFWVQTWSLYSGRSILSGNMNTIS